MDVVKDKDIAKMLCYTRMKSFTRRVVVMERSGSVNWDKRQNEGV